VKKACRNDKNAYIESICCELEGFADRAMTKELFKYVKILTRDFKAKTWLIEDENGSLVSDQAKVASRWRQYCADLYTDSSGSTQDDPPHRIDEPSVREPDILLEEVSHAINRLKNKALGGDGISAEMLKHLGDVGAKAIHQICQKVWRTGQWPDDWMESVVMPLHKKGSTRKCENFRTISLISHASKILLDIINKRLAGYVDWQIPEEQAGFVSGRGTREQILNIRLIIEKCREFNTPAVLCFIDYSKAFDCVGWENLLQTLGEWGVPDHLIILIQNLYLDGKSRVRIDDMLSEAFHTERGVRQGCILSPKLFNIYGECIMRKALEGWEGGISIGGEKITNLRFADDTTLIASSVEELNQLMQRVELASETFGLMINRTKTKAMIIDRGGVLEGAVQPTAGIDLVSQFVYLGSLINANGACDQEVVRRIQMAKTAMTRLDKIWKSRDIARATKMRLIRALVFSVFHYASETWTLRAQERRRIDAFEMWCWRRLLRVHWSEHRTNDSIRSEIGIVTPLSTECEQRILRFFGHITRRGPDSLERRIMVGMVWGRRGRGRLPTKWSDIIRGATGTTLRGAMAMAEDREGWRELVRGHGGHDPRHRGTD
jgi:hypothetical protein